MAQYWFKPKCYGWGIAWPIAWQGWVAMGGLVVIIPLAALACGFFKNRPGPPGPAETFLSFIVVISLAILFCWVFRHKIEGGLKWRWGDKE